MHRHSDHDSVSFIFYHSLFLSCVPDWKCRGQPILISMQKQIFQSCIVGCKFNILEPLQIQTYEELRSDSGIRIWWSVFLFQQWVQIWSRISFYYTQVWSDVKRNCTGTNVRLPFTPPQPGGSRGTWRGWDLTEEKQDSLHPMGK